jgi:hypothetical protein
MRTETITKFYGVKRLHNGRFAVVTDIDTRQGHRVYSCHQDLSYKKLDFAIKKAKIFIKTCYKPFIRTFGCEPTQINFEYFYCGIVN